jgi:hypothetical protein
MDLSALMPGTWDGQQPDITQSWRIFTQVYQFDPAKAFITRFHSYLTFIETR